MDELQDINEMEADIAMRASRNKFFVGDRKQSILGFHGGTLRIFNTLKNDTSWTNAPLGRNYRSLKNILEYSKNYFLKNTSD